MFHRTAESSTPSIRYGFEALGRPRPVTPTSLRPDCFTASAAPGTAGEAMAMITLTLGWTRSSVCVSSNAFLRSSSLGRMSTIFRFGYFSGSSLRISAIQEFWLAAVSDPVMIADLAAGRAGEARRVAEQRRRRCRPASPG